MALKALFKAGIRRASKFFGAGKGVGSLRRAKSMARTINPAFKSARRPYVSGVSKFRKRRAGAALTAIGVGGLSSKRGRKRSRSLFGKVRRRHHRWRASNFRGTSALMRSNAKSFRMTARKNTRRAQQYSALGRRR